MSTTPNHTPGPWKAQCATYNQWQIYCPLGHPSTIATLRGSFLDPQACANARLIAAAPEMLAVLQSFVADCREWREADPEDDYHNVEGFIERMVANWEDAEAAISKATQTLDPYLVADTTAQRS